MRRQQNCLDNRISRSCSREWTHGTHYPGMPWVLNISWGAWTSTWMRKFTESYLADKNDTHIRRCPELCVVRSRRLGKDAAVGNSCWAQQTHFSCPCIPACSRAWALRTSSDPVGVFQSVSATGRWEAAMPPEESVRFVDILAGNIFENESAIRCWFLAALRRTPTPPLQPQRCLFAEQKLQWVFWQPFPFQDPNCRFRE